MEIGTILSYGPAGVCEITDIRMERTFEGKALCYVLSPISDERTTIFVPTDNEVLIAKMHRLMTAEEIETLIQSIPTANDEWIKDERQRTEEYKRILDNGSCDELVCLIKTLRKRKKEVLCMGKRLRISDGNFLKQAENKLHNEIAYVLGIPRDEVDAYIQERIS